MQSAKRRAFTLVELLTVIGIIGVLAALIGTAMLYAHRHAVSVTCQHNLSQIGTAVLDLAQTNGGLLPNLTNAYPNPDPTYQDPITGKVVTVPVIDYGFPWWARVYQEIDPDPQGGLGLLFAKTKVQEPGIVPAYYYYCYETSTPTAGTLDAALNPNGHVLTSQLPPTFANLFHCGMAGTLASPNPILTPAQNYVDFFNSLSYGINFDVKLANGTPYTCVATTATNYPALAIAPGSDPPYTAIQDMNPDPFYIADMKNPGAFILISEAYTGEGPPIRPNPIPPYWTGGRIAMQATEGLSSNVCHPAPIVGRHDGRANVLYGDLHVASEQAVSGGTQTININVNTPLWTLPGE